MKPIQERNAVEICLSEVMEVAERLEIKLKKIEAVADMILTKSSMSHSLLVVKRLLFPWERWRSKKQWRKKNNAEELDKTQSE